MIKRLGLILSLLLVLLAGCVSSAGNQAVGEWQLDVVGLDVSMPGTLKVNEDGSGVIGVTIGDVEFSPRNFAGNELEFWTETQTGVSMRVYLEADADSISGEIFSDFGEFAVTGVR